MLWVALVVGAEAVDMDVPATHLGAATIGAGLLAVVFGAIALLVGAATGRAAVAVGVASAGAVAAYLVNSLAALVDALEPIQKVSPFYHYAAPDPLRHGLSPVTSPSWSCSRRSRRRSRLSSSSDETLLHNTRRTAHQ